MYTLLKINLRRGELKIKIISKFQLIIIDKIGQYLDNGVDVGGDVVERG